MDWDYLLFQPQSRWQFIRDAELNDALVSFLWSLIMGGLLGTPGGFPGASSFKKAHAADRHAAIPNASSRFAGLIVFALAVLLLALVAWGIYAAVFLPAVPYLRSLII
jgi:hypothetical protein